MITTRRFDINIKCASCKQNLETIFKKYEDISWSINITEKILKIVSDEQKYSDEFIEELLSNFGGYIAKRID